MNRNYFCIFCMKGSEMYIQVGSDLCQVLHLTSTELAKLSYSGIKSMNK